MLTDPARCNWYLTFGIDGTAISGKRKFTHAALSLGAMYKDEKVVLTELKALTLAIGQHHDDSTGLALMLRRKTAFPGKEGGGAVTSLAEEIKEVYTSGRVRLSDSSEVPCGLRCCLDLVAARGMRGSRGKSACYCGCQGQGGRQMLPGDGEVEAIPDGDDLATWREAERILLQHC
eukprot:6209715-Pleurochrysis_carterae.AAC.1